MARVSTSASSLPAVFLNALTLPKRSNVPSKTRVATLFSVSGGEAMISPSLWISRSNCGTVRLNGKRPLSSASCVIVVIS